MTTQDDIQPLGAFRQSPLAAPIILGAFCLTTALILAGSDQLTRAPIAARQAEDLQVSLGQVLPSALPRNDPARWQIVLTDPDEGSVDVFRTQNGQGVTGAALELTGYGYSGAIRVLVGVAPDGRILGVRVLSHTETPGLGDKIEAKKSDWVDDFAGRSLGNPPPEGWQIRRDGGIFDQFSGASITPRAVVQTVARALALVQRHHQRIFSAPQETQP